MAAGYEWLMEQMGKSVMGMMVLGVGGSSTLKLQLHISGHSGLGPHFQDLVFVQLF